MTWIHTVSYEEADGPLRRAYDRIAAPGGQIDQIMMAHSLRPHSMNGHMALYKRVLHHAANVIPEWFLEALGVYTSLLNECQYCAEHHFAGMARLLNDAGRSAEIWRVLEEDRPEDAFDPQESAAMAYARMLTLEPASCTAHEIDRLRSAGWTDGEILEINQVTAYFCYANRTVLGLGVTSDGEVLGLSPGTSGDESDWTHR